MKRVAKPATKPVVKPKVVPKFITPMEASSYEADLKEIRRQINDLMTIEAFLQVRIDQIKQNQQWIKNLK